MAMQEQTQVQGLYPLVDGPTAPDVIDTGQGAPTPTLGMPAPSQIGGFRNAWSERNAGILGGHQICMIYSSDEADVTILNLIDSRSNTRKIVMSQDSDFVFFAENNSRVHLIGRNMLGNAHATVDVDGMQALMAHWPTLQHRIIAAMLAGHVYW